MTRATAEQWREITRIMIRLRDLKPDYEYLDDICLYFDLVVERGYTLEFFEAALENQYLPLRHEVEA